MAKVHLDFGHGGRDPGGVGNGLQEKDIVLRIGINVASILKRHNVTVFYSRTDDEYLTLTQRANLANKNNVDIFCSIHLNAFNKEIANGVETFSHVGSVKGAKIAQMVQDELINAKLFKTNRGTKTARFTVLAKTKAPAILTELGFITNKEDSIVIKNKQNELAEAVAKGLLKALNIEYKEVIIDDGSLYKVQAGAYSSKDNAEKKLAELKAKGIDGFIKKE